MAYSDSRALIVWSAICTAVEVNRTCQRSCNECIPVSHPYRTYGKHQHLVFGYWKVRVFFLSTSCHRWWESLCNANIISHCVGPAPWFSLCTKQPGCGVIYQYGEKKTSLGLHWKGYAVGGSCRSACCDFARLDFIDSLVHPVLCAIN